MILPNSLRRAAQILILMMFCVTGAMASINHTNNHTAAAACNFTISPDSHFFPASGGEVTVNITAYGTPGDPCGWTTLEGSTWLSLSRVAGNGSGSLKVTAAPNTTGASRTAYIQIAGRQFVAIQAANCVYTASVSNQVFDASGGSATLTINANTSACSWTVSENANWITLSGATSGLGSKQIQFTVAANNGAARQATLIVTAPNKTFQFPITQYAPCQYTINPLGRSFNANGGNGSITVGTSNLSCQWSAVSNNSWIAVTSGANGQGAGTVGYSVAPNGGAARVGSITIAGKTFTVSQEALAIEAPVVTSLSPGAAFAGTPTFTLTVNGANFNGASRVQWNGSDRPTVFVGKTQLQALILASDVAVAGKADVSVRDTAANLTSNTVKFSIFGAVANVSAASFDGEALAPESMVSAFGSGLAIQTAVADGLPLPTSLAGSTVLVRDSRGVEQLAQIFFVSPGQINYLMPAGLADGAATVIVTAGDGRVLSGQTEIARVAPGIFSADNTGKGLASAVALRVRADGQQAFEPVALYNPELKNFQASPIDLSAPGEQVFLIIFGTGFRHRSSLDEVKIQIGSLAVEPLYAGEAPGLLGMDQINVLLPNELAGAGEVDVVIKVDGKTANVVKLNFK